VSWDDAYGDRPGGAPRPIAMRCRVVDAPATSGDSMTVRAVNSGHDYDVPAGQWTVSTALPVAGAFCLVLIDDDGDAWVPIYA
jgi:hypothetical protein